jgi:hypothetical protein
MKVIKEKLLDTKAFKKTFNKPKKAAEDYGSARDIQDENKASSKDFAFMCDVSSVYTNEKTGATKAGKIEEYLFRKGQTFCDSKTGKAFTCEDAIKCAEAATDPSKADANKQKTDAFKKIWKEVAADKTKGKMFFVKNILPLVLSAATSFQIFLKASVFCLLASALDGSVAASAHLIASSQVKAFPVLESQKV